tara:strand:- start:12256 stop:12552 length:297 start_codon:yes stop_codon:yes gene_type:complete
MSSFFYTGLPIGSGVSLDNNTVIREAFFDSRARTVVLLFGLALTENAHIYRDEVSITTTLSVGRVAVRPVNLTVSTTVGTLGNPLVIVVQHVVIDVEA